MSFRKEKKYKLTVSDQNILKNKLIDKGMKILYRLGYYLGGFSVGLILLAFIFSGKKTSCNYSPSARVKDNLLQKEIRIPSDLQSQLPQMSDSIIRDYIDQGEINFSKSNTKRDSCRLYYIEIESKTLEAIEVTNCAKTITLISFKKP